MVDQTSSLHLSLWSWSFPLLSETRWFFLSQAPAEDSFSVTGGLQNQTKTQNQWKNASRHDRVFPPNGAYEPVLQMNDHNWDRQANGSSKTCGSYLRVIFASRGHSALTADIWAVQAGGGWGCGATGITL